MKEEWKGLNLAELIALLEPIPEPDSVSMLPQTAGWIWLSLLFLGVTVLLLHRIRLHRRKNAYRREALNELARCRDDPAAIALLLRRTALAAYPRATVASLFGKEWLRFLDSTYGGDGFSNGPGQALSMGPYQHMPADAPVASLVEEWIKQHRIEGFDV
ncbi:DUF4381 domain-containing protein [Labrenzia sp. DG1229]|uniref:DUF4381 domain-containing protein n=1 Tax=Labrenzia sp. DG1229 TaxID=681847 RepID=UPI00048D1851|nr:DUF4381 domain-containing protein [Labrenzia sp. DG1229]